MQVIIFPYDLQEVFPHQQLIQRNRLFLKQPEYRFPLHTPVMHQAAEGLVLGFVQL